MDASIAMTPIGVYRSEVRHPYEAARQPRADDSRPGEIHLEAGHDFERALVGLESFERVWIVFLFDRNKDWKPMVRPPRGTDGKIGVFATRAPYRPNAIGLSCVRLLGIEGRRLLVAGADLLDGTPILDLKPYLPEADAFPEARVGWLEGVEQDAFAIEWSPEAQAHLVFLRAEGVEQLEHFVRQQLEHEPFDGTRKRVRANDDGWMLAYRTWRVHFQEIARSRLRILSISSGYSADDLRPGTDDKWGDKDVHRRFLLTGPKPAPSR